MRARDTLLPRLWDGNPLSYCDALRTTHHKIHLGTTDLYVYYTNNSTQTPRHMPGACTNKCDGVETAIQADPSVVDQLGGSRSSAMTGVHEGVSLGEPPPPGRQSTWKFSSFCEQLSAQRKPSHLYSDKKIMLPITAGKKGA